MIVPAINDIRPTSPVSRAPYVHVWLTMSTCLDPAPATVWVQHDVQVQDALLGSAEFSYATTVFALSCLHTDRRFVHR